MICLKAIGENCFPSLLKLSTVILSYNHITCLDGLSTLPNLKFLDLRANQLGSVSALNPLKACEHLDSLLLQSGDGQVSNPLCQSPDYRETTCNALPSLTSLDEIEVERVDSITPLFDKVASRFKSRKRQSDTSEDDEQDALSRRLESIQQKLEIERLETKLALLGQHVVERDPDPETNRIVHTRVIQQPEPPLRLERSQADLAMDILRKEPISASDEIDFAIHTLEELGRTKLDQTKLGSVLRICFPDLEGQTLEQLFQTLSPKRKSVPSLLVQDLLHSIKDQVLRKKKQRSAVEVESVSTQCVRPVMVDAETQVIRPVKTSATGKSVQVDAPVIKRRARSTQTSPSSDFSNNDENKPPNSEASAPWQAMSFLQSEMQYIRQRLDGQLGKPSTTSVDDEGKEEWEAQLSELRLQLQRTEEQHAREIDEVTDTVDALKELREKLEHALVKEREELSRVKQSLVMSETKQAELEREIQRLESGGQVAQEQLAARAAEASIKLERVELELNQAKEEGRRRAEEARQLELRVSTVLTGEADLRQRVDAERAASLAAKDELSKAKASLKLAFEERDKAESVQKEQLSAITNLKKALRESKRVENEKALDLDVLAGLVRDQKEHIRSLVPTLKRTQLELERSKMQKETLLQEVEEMRLNLSRFKEIQGTSENQKLLTDKARNDAKQLAAKLEETAVENKELKARLEASVSDLETNLKIKVAMLEDQNKQIASLKAKNVAAKDEISRLRSDYEEKLDIVQSARNAAEEALEDQERALEKYETVLREYEDDKDVAKVQQLQEELAKKEEALEYAEKELQSLVQKFSSRDEEYRRKEADFSEQLKTKNQEASQRIQDLLKALEAQTAKVTILEEETTDLKKASNDIAAKLDSTKRDLEQERSAKAAADLKLSQMQREIGILGAALESERAKNSLNLKRFEKLVKEMK